MIKTCLTPTFLAAAALTCNILYAQGTAAVNSPAVPAAGGYLLRYQYKVGDVYTYKTSNDTTTTMNMGSGAPSGMAAMMPKNMLMHSDAVSTSKVVGMRPSDGAAAIQTTTALQDGTMNGQDMSGMIKSMMANFPVITAYMNDRGNMVGMDMGTAGTGPSTVPGLGTGAATSSFVVSNFPEGPVKVGDTWEASMSAAGMSLTGHSHLESVTTGANGTVVRVITRLSGSMHMSSGPAARVDGPIKETTDVLFNVDHGQMESMITYSDTSSTMPMPGAAGGGSMSMHVISKVAMTRTDAQ